MKLKYVFILGLFLITETPLYAAGYNAQCMNPKGNFSDCNLLIKDEVLNVQYKSSGYQSENRSIPGKKITRLSGGEYSRRRVAEAVLLTPWMLFSKKKRDNFGIEYIGDNNKKNSLSVQVKKKYGLALKAELQAMSGRDVEMEAKPAKK